MVLHPGKDRLTTRVNRDRNIGSLTVYPLHFGHRVELESLESVKPIYIHPRMHVMESVVPRGQCVYECALPKIRIEGANETNRERGIHTQGGAPTEDIA